MMQSIRGSGRHRLRRVPLTFAQRLGAAAVLVAAAGTTAAVWPTSAIADAPVQTAWWNTASGSGQAAPDPATPDGGLHISVAPGGPTGAGQVLAFGAVLYDLANGAGATLELTVNAAGIPNPNPDYPTESTQPNINLVACPTTQPWKSGGDQPGPGPAYDCTHSINGNLSADGKTVTFLVDTGGQMTPGQLSLAIVPVFNDTVPVVRTEVPGQDMTEPFSVDTDKPGPDSLMVTSPPPPTPTTAKPAGAPAAAGTSTASTSGGSAPASGGGGPAPAINVPAASTTTSTPDSGSAPVVAGTTAPQTAPAAVVKPASQTGRNAAIALLILLGVALVLSNNSQLPRRGRHVLGRQPLAASAPGTAAGPAGPAGGGAESAVPGLDAATLALLTGYGSRGLGRFSKPRSAPPRPLV